MMETTTRYLRVFDDLRSRKRWGTDVSTLRFVALTLASASPDDVVRLEGVAEALKQRAGRGSPLRSSIRYMVAAMILRRGLSPDRVHQQIVKTREAFRQRRMRRGGLNEILAALLLVLKQDGGAVPGWRIDKLQAIVKNWKQDHPWLTGADDYPMAALHATRENSVEEIALQVEQTYQALRDVGCSRGNQLQLASHLLTIAPASPREAARRFDYLVKAFRKRKWKIYSSRYDEVAVLALCSAQPAVVVRRVLDTQERLRTEKPRPSRDIAFSLAAGIVLSEDAVKQEAMAETRDVTAARMAQAVIEAQQAAMVACMAGAIAATTVATTSS
jgi:hypothetical protein